MKQWKVGFSVYQNASGTHGVANLCPGQTVVSAPNYGAAVSMVKGMFMAYPKVIVSSAVEVR